MLFYVWFDSVQNAVMWAIATNTQPRKLGKLNGHWYVGF